MLQVSQHLSQLSQQPSLPPKIHPVQRPALAFSPSPRPRTDVEAANTGPAPGTTERSVAKDTVPNVTSPAQVLL